MTLFNVLIIMNNRDRSEITWQLWLWLCVYLCRTVIIDVPSPHSPSFSVNTGAAMDSNTYLPKQECQFLHLVMEELETYQSDGDKMRYWKNSLITKMSWIALWIVVFIPEDKRDTVVFVCPVCFCFRPCPADWDTWFTVTSRSFLTSPLSL